MSWTWLDDGVGSAEHGSGGGGLGKALPPFHAKQAANSAESSWLHRAIPAEEAAIPDR